MGIILMKIFAYIDGQLKFNLDINLPYEKLNNMGREYLGIKGSQELLTLFKQIEEQLKTIFPANEDVLPLDQLNLDDMNLNEYLIKKFPQLQQLELRADEDSYSSSVKNLFGKQYGYPLVWLNCNKYNHPVISNVKAHQWERCIYGSKLNSLDKIGSLKQHFSDTDEARFYQGNYDAWHSSVKNSFTDNLFLKYSRQATSVIREIANMKEFQPDNNFAVYENDDKKQVTYITMTTYSEGETEEGTFERKIKDGTVFALKESLEKHLDSSKTVKILFPIELSNGSYEHVVMGSITLTKPGEVTLCDITVYDALISNPFASEEKLELEKIKQQIEAIFAEKGALVEFSTDIYNMKYQLPLQTHCGRFVMTWMAAEAAGLDIKKLSNYNELFNYIFGQIVKENMNFDARYQRVSPEKALEDFKHDLNAFLIKRQIKFRKQWTSAGEEDLVITKSFLELIEAIETGSSDALNLIKKLEELSPHLANLELKNIIDNGMVNLGYGSLHSFLIQAQATDFQFLPRTAIDLQYQKIDELIKKMEEDTDALWEEAEKDDTEEESKEKELEDDFLLIPDIDDKQLASDIQPGKALEQQSAESISTQQKLKEKMRAIKEESEPQNPKTVLTK